MRTILLVEDDDNDVFFFRRALAAVKRGIDLRVTANGREALRYLRQQKPFADPMNFPVPALVLLDLKTPYVSGLDFLREVRADRALRMLPVVVLTSSEAESDVAKAYHLGANSFLVKPTTIEDRQQMVHAIVSYWLDWNQVPPPVTAALPRAGAGADA